MKNNKDTLSKENKQYLIILEKRLKELVEINNKVNDENRKLNTTIINLKNNNEQLNITISNLKNRQEELEKDKIILENIKEKNLSLKNQIKMINETHAKLFEENKKSITTINNLNNEIKNLKIKNDYLLNEERIGKIKLKKMEKNNLILKESNANYEKKIDEFEKSNSWKITKPLRKIKKNI